MATTIDADFDALLEPIPGDNPAGVDLRGDDSAANPWYTIKDHRGDARRAERDLETWDPETEKGAPPDPLPDWRKLLNEAVSVVTKRTKDLEIVAYMIEALVRTDGFAGLAKGLALANGLIERYWDQIYPRPEESDPGATVLSLAQLNGFGGGGVILGPLSHVPITNDPGGESFAYWQYLEAHNLKTLPHEDQAKRLDRGAVSLDRFKRSSDATPKDFFKQFFAETQEALAELARLDALLDARLPNEFKPSFTAIREQVEDIERAVRTFAPFDAEPSANANGQAAGAAPGAMGVSIGGISSRDEAFRQLSLIADFFEKTEPLSLLAEQIRKVVRLGRMSPQEYFSQLIESEDIRRQVFRLVGIKVEDQTY